MSMARSTHKTNKTRFAKKHSDEDSLGWLAVDWNLDLGSPMLGSDGGLSVAMAGGRDSSHKSYPPSAPLHAATQPRFGATVSGRCVESGLRGDKDATRDGVRKQEKEKKNHKQMKPIAACGGKASKQAITRSMSSRVMCSAVASGARAGGWPLGQTNLPASAAVDRHSRSVLALALSFPCSTRSRTNNLYQSPIMPGCQGHQPFI